MKAALFSDNLQTNKTEFYLPKWQICVSSHFSRYFGANQFCNTVTGMANKSSYFAIIDINNLVNIGKNEFGKKNIVHQHCNIKCIFMPQTLGNRHSEFRADVRNMMGRTFWPHIMHFVLQTIISRFRIGSNSVIHICLRLTYSWSLSYWAISRT